VIALAVLLGAPADAAVATEAEPHQGTETAITLTDADGQPASGETVRVVHRPGLAGEQELAVGITDGRGRVKWTPSQPGVTRIRAGDQVLLVRVAPAAVGASTPVSLGLLAAIALGALLWGFAERR
jgi:hypothetical protein